jgi:hypothetical protein
VMQIEAVHVVKFLSEVTVARPINCCVDIYEALTEFVKFKIYDYDVE